MTTRLGAVEVACGRRLRTASVGLRNRRLRAGLSALGIMIGIAAMVGVLGLSESSKSELLAQLDRLGTNLLTVQAGAGIGIGSGELPDEAAGMIARIGPVETDEQHLSPSTPTFTRTTHPSEGQTGGITVQAVDINLLDTLAGSVADGKFLDEATAPIPRQCSGRWRRNGSASAPSPAPSRSGWAISGSPLSGCSTNSS